MLMSPGADAGVLVVTELARRFAAGDGTGALAPTCITPPNWTRSLDLLGAPAAAALS